MFRIKYLYIINVLFHLFRVFLFLYPSIMRRGKIFSGFKYILGALFWNSEYKYMNLDWTYKFSKSNHKTLKIFIGVISSLIYSLYIKYLFPTYSLNHRIYNFNSVSFQYKYFSSTFLWFSFALLAFLTSVFLILYRR